MDCNSSGTRLKSLACSICCTSLKYHWEFFQSQSDSKIESCCSNFDPYTSSHFDSFLRKTSQFNQENWVRLTQIRLWLSFWVNWLGNWVTRNNANIFESTWLNNWVMVEFESIWLGFSGSNWLVFLKNESKILDAYESKLGQHDSIFESLWLGKKSQW